MATTLRSRAEPNGGTFSALRQREFALLWYGSVGQSIGLGMQQIALGYFVWDSTRSELWVGAVAFMNFAPFFLFSPFAGVFGDRFDRRKLLFIAQALSGLSVLSLAVLITSGLVEMWQVLAVALLSATGQALTVPTRLAYVNDLVEPQFLMNAVALNSLAQNGMRIVGPVLAGIFIAIIGAGGTMYMNAAGYLLGLIPLAMMQARPRPPTATRAPLHEIVDGIAFMFRTPIVFFVINLGNIFALFGMPYLSMLPVFAEDVLGVGSLGYGLLSSASGVGAVLGGIALARVGDTPHKLRLFKGCYLLFVASLVVFSLSPWMWLSLILMFVIGISSMSCISLGVVILQQNTPRELQARVMSLWTWGIALAFLGALPVGALSERFGAPITMAVTAAFGVGSGLVLMTWYASNSGKPTAAKLATSPP
ncbi:MAG: MFS transporter [Tepidiformaceae bacterium]